jgi:hypothetical protein
LAVAVAQRHARRAAFSRAWRRPFPVRRNDTVVFAIDIVSALPPAAAQ